MPWSVEKLADLRRQVRDNIAGSLPGADATIANTPLRAISDNQAGMAAATLDYIREMARQLLPDTADEEWLIRHADIQLGGAAPATFASGAATFTGTPGVVVPIYTEVSTAGILFETTAAITLGAGATEAPLSALTPGLAGNVEVGAKLQIVTAISGVDGAATVVRMSGGLDAETGEPLRARVLDKIRRPPMGGCGNDYRQWVRETPGLGAAVTRVWVSPNEMGIGTVTIRFMLDVLRATNNGLPTGDDLAAVKAYLDTKRPVAIKDLFVVAPILTPVSVTVDDLTPDTSANRGAVIAAMAATIFDRAAPADELNGVRQPATTIYNGWLAGAALSPVGVDHARVLTSDVVMPTNGSLAYLASVSFV